MTFHRPDGSANAEDADRVRHRAARKNFGRLDPQFLAFEVGHVPERFVITHDFEAVIPIGQTDKALGLKFLEQLGPYRSLGYLMQFSVIIKDERQVEEFKLLQAQRSELGQ